MTELTGEIVCEEHSIKGQCALHRLLWEHHDNDRREHRTELCNDILGISKAITGLVPRWVFVLVVGASFAFSLILFSWLTASVSKGQDSIDNTLKRIHQRISETDAEREQNKDALMQQMESVKLSVATMSGRLTNVETRISEIKR